jgi:hypothetical protein
LVLPKSQAVYDLGNTGMTSLSGYLRDSHEHVGAFVNEHTGLRSQILIQRTAQKITMHGTVNGGPIDMILNEHAWY